MTFALLFIGVWVAAVAIYWVLNNSMRSQDADRVKSRLLGGQKKEKAKAEGPSLLQTVSPEGKLTIRMMRKLKLHDRVQSLIEQAGLRWTVTRFAQISLGLFLAVFVIVYYIAPPRYQAGAFLAGAIAAVLPFLWLVRAKNERLHKFEEQFPEALEFVSRSMRAGHAFSVSLEMIHREFVDPLGGEFRRAFEEHNLGLPLDVALESLQKRIPSLDVQFFVSAVVLQKRTGGNLAEVLDKLAYIIRERFKLRGKIRAISAHGRMTGLALTSIPIGVAVITFFTNPPYVKFFFTEDIGNMMLGGAIFLQVVGYLIIQKIVEIEV